MSMPQDNPYAAPQTFDMTSPGAEWAVNDSPALRRTGLGLSLVYYGIITLLLTATVGAIVVPFLLPKAPMVLIVVGIAIMAGFLLLVIGPILCLAVPSESGAKGFILGSVTLQVINVAFSVAQQFAGIPQALIPVTQLVSIVSAILFVMFMKKLAEYIGRPDLAKRAQNVLIIGVVLLLVAIVAAGAMAVNPMFGMLGLVLAVLGLMAFVMYANLVDALRKGIQNRPR